MAYMNQEKKAQVSALLKPILKKYGVKGSLSVRNHMTLVLTITQGSIDFIGNFNRTVDKTVENNIDVNPYWFHDHFSGKAKQCLTEVFRAMKGADWYDRSDAMTDYFDTAYYVDVNIGKWNKPYTLVK